MAVYSKADLASANACISVLRNDIQDATHLSDVIKSFCDDSVSHLKGDSWDLIRTNLNDYVNLLALRKTVATDLISIIESVNNNLIASLGDYSEIDTDYLDEQQTLYNQCKNNIESLEKSSTSTDHDLEYYNNMLVEINKMINQINEVKSAEQSSLSSLEQAANSLVSYSAKVDEIPVPIISYTESSYTESI